MSDEDRIFSEGITHFEIEDESAGEFIKISQDCDNEDYKHSITIDERQWPLFKQAIEQLIKDLRP